MEFHWYQLLIPMAAAAVGYYARHLIERRRELQSEVNKERRAVYQQFVDLVINDLKGSAVEETAVDPEYNANEAMYSFLKKAMLYASPDVINAFGDYRQYVFGVYYTKKTEMDPRINYQKLANIISEMREDLGLSNKDLGVYGEEAFKGVLIDYDNYFKG